MCVSTLPSLPTSSSSILEYAVHANELTDMHRIYRDSGKIFGPSGVQHRNGIYLTGHIRLIIVESQMSATI